MIIDFGAKNFFSFKEGFHISFMLGKSCPEDISGGKELSDIICVKGANGSGKTNVLKAIHFISCLIVESFDHKPGAYLHFDNYFRNDYISEFYVTFTIDNLTYRYEADLTDTHIKREALFRKGKREVKVFERIDNKLTYFIKEFSDLNTIPKLRDNVSIISISSQFELASTKKIHQYFSKTISNVSYGGLLSETIEFSRLNKFLFDHKTYLDFVTQMVARFDPAIKDIFIRESSDDEDKDKTYIPWFMFDVDGRTDALSFNQQSSGTKSLYKQLGSYKAVLDTGGLLILDEFDINLHPHILPHLLNIFLDAELNPKGAQLLFTTHNTDILDFLGKHRTYLVNKDNTESYCYRLDDIPSDILRNGRSITPAYNQGKIGGVPKI